MSTLDQTPDRLDDITGPAAPLTKIPLTYAWGLISLGFEANRAITHRDIKLLSENASVKILDLVSETNVASPVAFCRDIFVLILKGEGAGTEEEAIQFLLEYYKDKTVEEAAQTISELALKANPDLLLRVTVQAHLDNLAASYATKETVVKKEKKVEENPILGEDGTPEEPEEEQSYFVNFGGGFTRIPKCTSVRGAKISAARMSNERMDHSEVTVGVGIPEGVKAIFKRAQQSKDWVEVNDDEVYEELVAKVIDLTPRKKKKEVAAE